ncbi:MAG: NADH-quinone oxidoreductase subunit M [Desulfobulbaceae bacterium]|nr:NADH-quinone oxidoreductase subunit M [Desulfobulbaceae bacterium]
MNQLLINSGFPWLNLLVGLPLAGALILLVFGKDTISRQLTLIITLVNALCTLPVLHGFDSSNTAFQFAHIYTWIPQLHINYTVGVDGISILLVALTTLVMPLCVLASWTYINKRITAFMVCLLVMESAMIGVFIALDFVLFYIFWEFMLIPMYLLIAIWGGPRKSYASIKFFLYTLAGSVLLLVAIIALYLHNGTFFIPAMMWREYGQLFQLLIFLAFFLAFAIKVPMFPFHTWLPAAHVEAPTAGSVLLASILLKMGTYGFLRFCLPITPDASMLLATPLLWLSIAGIIYGGCTALAQQDMKKLIAYSSVGHMGFVTLGIFVFNLHGLQGAMLQMLNHGITTGALFLCIGMIYERNHSRDLAKATGLGPYMPWFATFFTFFSLSAFAFPGTNSFIGEFLVLAGAFAHKPALALAAVPGALLAAAYMLRLLQKVIWGGVNNPDQSKLSDLGLREILVLAPLLLFVFWIGLGPQPFLDYMNPTLNELLQKLHEWQQGQQGMSLNWIF